MEKELLSLWLPVGLVGKFDLEKVEPFSDGHHLFLSQKKVPPTWGEGHKLKSKGFYDSVIIRDFPLRGKAFYLHLKRRHDLGKNIYHEWS